jgi:hypothetical protein
MTVHLPRLEPFEKGDGQTRPPPRPQCWKENAQKWVSLITAVLRLAAQAYKTASVMLF